MAHQQHITAHALTIENEQESGKDECGAGLFLQYHDDESRDADERKRYDEIAPSS